MPYVPPTTHVTFHATIRRERLLPSAGEVLVQEGQEVDAADVVAQTYIADKHSLIYISQRLGVPKDRAGKYMTKQDGDSVKKGERIAARQTMFGLNTIAVRAPFEGQLVISGDGKALLAAYSKPTDVKAGFPGRIVSVIPGRGVVVETVGALVQGVWGNGKEDWGLLKPIGDGPLDVMRSENLDVSLRDQILITGHIKDETVFKELDDIHIKGLIVGSIDAAFIPRVLKINYPVLVVNGFGQQGLPVPAYRLLTDNAGREACLNACQWNRFTGKRPELVLPLPSSSQAPPPPVTGSAIAVNQRVVIRRGPSVGRTGVIAALSDRAIALPSGVRARAASVLLDSVSDASETVTIPLANLEILE